MRSALAYIYPDLRFLAPSEVGAGVVLRNDGSGVYIAEWTDPRPQPTAQELLDAQLPATKAERIASIRAEARTRIESVYPEWRQRSAALGVYPAEYVAQMQAGIAAVIAASNAGEDAVDAAADAAEVEAVSVSWPVI